MTLREPVVHAGEHALYLWAALIFWAPLIAVDPVPHRLSPIGGIALHAHRDDPDDDRRGLAAHRPDRVVYPHYAAFAGALADQRNGAVVMWLGGGIG